jgi:hypothetical protein
LQTLPVNPSTLPVRLHLSRTLTSKYRELIREIEMGLPPFDGDPILISTRPRLTAHRGQLFSLRPRFGTPVYAASFIPERRIVLATELFDDTQALRLTLVHEWFHFVWPRLGNPRRLSFEALLQNERCRGELGESAALGKKIAGANARHWKNYVCESFCDTGAWMYAGVQIHASFTLAPRCRVARSKWFRQIFEG